MSLTAYALCPIFEGVVEINVTGDFEQWWDGLAEGEQDDVTVAVDLLEREGVALGFPRSSAIKGASFPLRELRVQSEGHALRVFYAFDPWRDAVLLIGGDKTGDDRFYMTYIPLCERVWAEYLRERQKEEPQIGFSQVLERYYAPNGAG